MPPIRLAETPAPVRRRQAVPSLPLPPPETPRTARDVLLRSWPGRLFIVAVITKFLAALFRLGGEPPAFVQVLNSIATLAMATSLVYFVARLFIMIKRRLLWRVRRKLILSYIFIGVVPALLILFFFQLGAAVFSMNVSAYLFKDGYDDVIRDASVLSDAAAVEIARVPATAAETIARVQRNGARTRNHPSLSMLFVSTPGSKLPRASAGEWKHAPVPDQIPSWVSTAGFEGTVAVPDAESAAGTSLVIRSVKPAMAGSVRLGYVVVDIPVDGSLIDQLYETTGIRSAVPEVLSAAPGVPLAEGARAAASQPDEFVLFGRSVAFFDAHEWLTGRNLRATFSMKYRLGEIYGRLVTAQSAQVGSMSVAQAILTMLIFVAVLFLIIQMAALTMGLALARSITSSIHELFMGTERVRQGDFGHRIQINTKDQLGELADSFNQMTGSIENLLQTAAEKKRLEEELRIARQIQMSLLPRGPLEMPGLSVTALCVPAREVGGDYYDFFTLGHDRIGVLIADVSGKGTSAALYMAELKGLVLSLSQIYQSPRQLLLEVNRIISENLDSRSFITMTYAVLDLGKGVMTYARAGHTPLIYLAGPGAADRDARILVPNGMVLGLRIEGAAEKFEELLEEDQVTLSNGDVIVLYTDGITEAMNDANDLFGDQRLSRIIEEHGHLESGELRERILREIEAFVGGADQHDDMTMILIKIERAEAARVAV
jgi:sigma-B regulation protein RsbU (phosphoserine phosphatase)